MPGAVRLTVNRQSPRQDGHGTGPAVPARSPRSRSCPSTLACRNPTVPATLRASHVQDAVQAQPCAV